MKIKKECFTCLKNQSVQVMDLTHQSPTIKEKTSQAISSFITTIQNITTPPPQTAIDIYGIIASITQNSDIYKNIKSQCIQKAKKITNTLKNNKPIFKSPINELEWGIKIAALGNVIDYGSESAFNINSYCFNLDQLDFIVFDIDEFTKQLKNAKTLVYIADNAGENLFDEIFIEILKNQYPLLHIYYFVRGTPIINDITLKDLQTHPECQKIFDISEVIDSGVKSPGFIKEIASTKAQNLYDNADIVLAKGMGNFECLEDKNDPRIFLLFKIKCNVVAKYLKQPLGKMIFKKLN
ncbi:ARMT1-like domain-containing protein [Helicobacter sp. 13S00477-4]|uniref:damage-control phosphatase ARMT1 family protein n=1 Tax=Helicobacter sp. 13S00477-4 TaxID=1905759 RepID=UPI000BA66742|nr:ARMT1-like domain-containing protein [Helicobacter sp. 13S00477-4]PAF52802.1 hypothetical protein BKH44_01055 [Helicobacter sp. 13S00477-4]